MTETKNYYKIIGNTIQIRLDKRNDTHLWTLCDKAQLSKLAQYKWYAFHSGNTWYVQSHIQLKSEFKTSIKIHRLLMGLPRGDKREIDHINHNGLDNRIKNLRIVSKSQNQHNQLGERHNLNGNKFTSSHPGVSWHKNHHCWQSSIRLNGQNIYLGLFDTESKAAEIYLKAKTIRDTGGTPKDIKTCRHSKGKNK